MHGWQFFEVAWRPANAQNEVRRYVDLKYRWRCETKQYPFNYQWSALMSDALQAPVAFGAAQAYITSIEPAFRELEQEVRRCHSGASDAKTRNPGTIAPIVSGIAFAVELYLKVLQIQEGGLARRGHNVAKLWAQLSETTRIRIEGRYLTELLVWQTTAGLPFICLTTNGQPLETSAAPSPTCAEALARIGDAFEKWRYLYELMRPGGASLYFNFAEAFGVAAALRADILNFPGNSVVSLKPIK